MRKTGYLITIEGGRQPRTLMWDGHQPLPIGHPAMWVLEHSPQGLQLRELTVRGGSHRCLLVPPSALTGRQIYIPSGVVDTHLRIRHLRKPKAIFAPAGGSQTVASRWHQVLYCGMGDSLLAHRDVGSFFRVHHERQCLFTYEMALETHLIHPRAPGLILELPDGTTRRFGSKTERLSLYEWENGTFRWRNHWWKISYVPEPEKMARSVEQAAQATPQTLPSMKGFFTFALLTLGTLMLFAPGVKKKEIKIMQTKIELKAPKLVEALPKPVPPPPPKKIVEAKPKPKPLPPKPVEAKPVKIAKPREAKPVKVARKEPPKPKAAAPKPRIAAKRPMPQAPQRVTRAPVKRAPEPVIPPPQAPRISPEEIAARAQAQAARVAQQEAARQQAKAKAQLSQALGFLSTSASRPAVAVEAEQVADSANLQLQQRYDMNQAVADVGKTDSTYLNSLSEKGSDTRSISTRSARRISSDELAMGDSRSVGAGAVQGRVATSALGSGAGDGSGLGAGLGAGLDVSGSGEVSEAEIEKALEKHLARFQYCYEKVLLSDASLAGTILLQWTIGDSGRGQGVRVVRSQLNNNSLHNCLSGELARIQFPSPKGGAVIVKYPFAFSSGTL